MVNFAGCFLFLFWHSKVNSGNDGQDRQRFGQGRESHEDNFHTERLDREFYFFSSAATKEMNKAILRVHVYSIRISFLSFDFQVRKCLKQLFITFWQLSSLRSVTM